MTQAGSVLFNVRSDHREEVKVCVLGCRFSRITFCEHRNKWFDLAEAILSEGSQHGLGTSVASVIPADKWAK